MLTGCGGNASPVRTLSDSHGSPEALAEAVLDAIAREDAEALRSAMVTREEYRELFWPELPESDDMPFEAAWQMNEANSRNSRNGVMASFGETEFELVSVEFAGREEEYPSFTVRFDTKLIVRRASDGQVGALDVLSVVAERDGRWKALNFDDD